MNQNMIRPDWQNTPLNTLIMIVLKSKQTVSWSCFGSTSRWVDNLLHILDRWEQYIRMSLIRLPISLIKMDLKQLEIIWSKQRRNHISQDILNQLRCRYQSLNWNQWIFQLDSMKCRTIKYLRRHKNLDSYQEKICILIEFVWVIFLTILTWFQNKDSLQSFLNQCLTWWIDHPQLRTLVQARPTRMFSSHNTEIQCHNVLVLFSTVCILLLMMEQTRSSSSCSWRISN